MPINRTRVIIDFPPDEYATLMALCDEDLRLPSDELRFLTREAASRRGRLSKEAARPDAQATTGELIPA